MAAVNEVGRIFDCDLNSATLDVSHSTTSGRRAQSGLISIATGTGRPKAQGWVRRRHRKIFDATTRRSTRATQKYRGAS
jgi:hypothetical protein